MQPIFPAVLRAGAFSLLVFSAVTAVAAQSLPYGVVYRPLDIRYRVIETEHFDVVFEEGLDSLAHEAGSILEDALPGTRTIVGLRRRFRMPVILNNHNDQSNAFVSAAPFRQEIEAPQIKGKALSPRHPDWMSLVLPHELTHAVHAEIRPWIGLGGLLGLFGRDLSRIINFSTPSGFSEGIAVLRESRSHPEAGRLNDAFFNMQFRAAAFDRPWNLAQVATPPAHTFPFARHYIGGGHLFEYLEESVRPDSFHRTARFYNRFPFLGYGVAFWYGTGKAPWRIGRDFRETSARDELRRLAQLGPITDAQIISGRNGVIHRRPKWLNQNTLITYQSGYDLRAGFYQTNVETGKSRVIAHQAITEDYYYSLDPTKEALFFSRYVPDPTVPRRWISEVFELGVNRGEVARRTVGGRAHAPVLASPETIWAVQNDGQFTRWIRIDENGSIAPLSPSDRTSILEIAPSPDGSAIAVLANAAGNQGLFRATYPTDGTEMEMEPWLFFSGASVYDPTWSPDSRYVVFSADIAGVMNLYAFELESERVTRLTNTAFGALEPAVSPDGTQLAYIQYEHEQFDLALIPFEPAGLDTDVVLENVASYQVDRPADTSSLPEARSRPYRALRHLIRPRILMPIIERDITDEQHIGTDLGWRIGASVAGTDPLQQWSYALTGFHQASRLWGDVTVQTARSILRPFARIYNTPYTALSRTTGGQTVRLALEERGAEIGGILPVRIESNVYQTSATFSLRGGVRQLRQINAEGRPRSTFSNRTTIRPQAALIYRLQSNPRDLIPNTGVIISTTSRFDLTSDDHRRDRWLFSRLDAFLPVMTRHNHGLRADVSAVIMEPSTLYTGPIVWPRGFDRRGGLTQSVVRAGVEYLVPVAYVDNGFFMVPLHLNALYLYTFVESIAPVANLRNTASSLGGGLGLSIRAFFSVDVQVRIGAAYLPERNEWRLIGR